MTLIIFLIIHVYSAFKKQDGFSDFSTILGHILKIGNTVRVRISYLAFCSLVLIEGRRYLCKIR
jgi:hypothetical protein